MSTVQRRTKFAEITDKGGRFRSFAIISPDTPTVTVGEDGFMWLDTSTSTAPVLKVYNEDEDAWVATTSQVGTVDHNDLTNIDGGAADDYYHMTSVQNTAATRDATNAQNGLMPTAKLDAWDAAYTHVSNDGADHSFIDQSVISGASPTFDGANFTGIPIATGISGLAAGVATFLATPSSANLITAVTDETGSGALVFANTPTLVTPAIGAATGTSLVLTGDLTASGGGVIAGAAAQVGTVEIYDGSDHKVTITSPGLAGDWTLTLPIDNGDANEVLTTDGAGVTSWTAAGTGDVTAAANITDHTIVRGAGGAKGIQDTGITIDDTDNVLGMGTLGCGAITSSGTITGTNVFVSDGGTFGITGNELLTVNAAGNFTFSGITSLVVPDGAWVGADAACSWVFDSTNGDVTTLDKVGVGTTVPRSDAVFTVRQDSAIYNTNTIGYVASFNRINSDVAALYVGADTGNRAILAANAADLLIGKVTSGTLTEYVRILGGNGNGSIGGTPQGAKWDITATSSDTPGTNYLHFTDVGNNALQFGLRLDATSKDFVLDRAHGAVWHEVLRVKRSNGNVGIDEGTPAARLDVHNPSTIAQPCLELDQDDVSEGFINFVGEQSGAANLESGYYSLRVEFNDEVVHLVLYKDLL